MGLTFSIQKNKEDILSNVLLKQEKFENLVWAARKPCIDAPVEEWEYFANTDAVLCYPTTFFPTWIRFITNITILVR